MIKLKLINEDDLTRFVKQIVIDMKPELKSNLDKKDVQRIIEISSKNWLNQQESAKYLGISVNTFIAWRKKWKLESRTIENVTRWNKRDLDKFWFEHGVQGYL